MNTDIRLSTGFWQHPKTRKTVKRLGLEGVRSLQILWLWAAQNRPDGNLAGMDWEDIELAADWQGEEQTFFDHCLGVWIDENTEGCSLHDWAEHNPWQAEADARREQARKNAKSGWEKRKKVQSHEIGNADSMPLQSDGNAGAKRPHEIGNAPSPSPALKNKKEEYLKPHSSSENEDRARDTGSVRVGLGEKGAVSPGERAEEPPSAEFQELRAWYSEHCRPEGPLAGFTEYKQAKVARTWPGQTRIYDDLTARSASDKWQRGYAPSLATYLRTRGWEAPPEAEARASPPGPRAMTVRDAETLERNQRAKMLLAARAAREERHAQNDGDVGTFDLAGPALPAGAVHK